jgi:hypothetical protein
VSDVTDTNPGELFDSDASVNPHNTVMLPGDDEHRHSVRLGPN